MKTISRDLFFVLAAATGWLGPMSAAKALRPTPDFFVHVINATGQKIDVCTIGLKRCDTVLPGAMSTDAQATASREIVPIDPWIADTIVRGCAKIIPLKKLVALPRVARDSKAVSYSLTVSKESYLRECAAAIEAR